MKLKLREIRKNKKMTQEQLAAAVGASKRQIGAWERGENDIPMDYASAIADVLACTVDDIAGRASKVARMSTPSEQLLLEYYRSMDSQGRAALLEQAEFLAARHPLNQADSMGA